MIVLAVKVHFFLLFQDMRFPLYNSPFLSFSSKVLNLDSAKLSEASFVKKYSYTILYVRGIKTFYSTKNEAYTLLYYYCVKVFSQKPCRCTSPGKCIPSEKSLENDQSCNNDCHSCTAATNSQQQIVPSLHFRK